MRGIHDLGGMQGFGPVEVEENEPVFHERWEGRTYALTGPAVSAAGANTPMWRHGIERMDPAHYLSSSYYEHWLTTAATLLVEAGVVTHEELEERAGHFPLSRPATVTGDDIRQHLVNPGPSFAAGDFVRVRDVSFAGHTRCPGYLFGRRGTVIRVGSPEPVPEIEAHRRERVLQTTYCVRFENFELWGKDAEPNAAVHVDLYEEYLEAV